MGRKVTGASKTFLQDESGQAMLEYIIVIVFSVIVTIIFFRGVKRIVHRTCDAISASTDTD
jgi:Flp pilus assembly pilin Flp